MAWGMVDSRESLGRPRKNESALEALLQGTGVDVPSEPRSTVSLGGFVPCGGLRLPVPVVARVEDRLDPRDAALQ